MPLLTEFPKLFATDSPVFKIGENPCSTTLTSGTHSGVRRLYLRQCSPTFCLAFIFHNGLVRYVIDCKQQETVASKDKALCAIGPHACGSRNPRSAVPLMDASGISSPHFGPAMSSMRFCPHDHKMAATPSCTESELQNEMRRHFLLTTFVFKFRNDHPS